MAKHRTIVHPVAIGCTRFQHESDDCTVRALACVLDLPYDECHDLLKSFGRIDGQPINAVAMHRAFESVGIKLVAAYGTTNSAKWNSSVWGVKALKGRTLAKLLPELQNGRFIVELRAHVFAVVDGDVLDIGPMSGAVSVAGLYKCED